MNYPGESNNNRDKENYPGEETNNNHHQNNQNPYYQESNPYTNSDNFSSNINKNLIDDQSDNYREKINDQMRVGFIRKVYGVITVQLFITFLISSLGLFEDVKEYYKNNTWPFYTAVIMSFVSLLPLICFKKVAKRVPINYVLLFAFTIFESIMISYLIASVGDWKIVLTAAVLTLGVVSALTAYACTTKDDFTFCGGFLFACLVIMFFLGLFSFLFNEFFRILYCSLAVLVFSIYLLVDTQLIMGGFGLEYGIDDYIIAALNVYLDIIQIFVYILSILSSGRN